MSERDILNPVSKWVDAIQDNPSPDYGFTRGRSDLRARVKAPGGSPDSREVQNGGHTFRLSWLNRSYLCVQRVMRFAAQYEDGFFTIIDQDGGGRHYVGRFVGDVSEVQQGNDSYDLRDLTFEEYPGAPMLQYPSDWDRDSIYLNVATDGGKQNVATLGTWARGAYASDDNRNLVTLENAGTAGEFVAMDYRGYGFKLWMQTGPAYGQVQVYLDGVLQTKTFDDGSTTQTIDLYSADPAAPSEALVVESVPLDLHRVKVVALGTKSAASTANAVSFVRLQVMR